MPPPAPSLEHTFAPVRSLTAFEETLDRLATAIKIGVLAPGARLPAERELCARMAISRSTLRQALNALTQSGHLRAVRGRGGGTFVADAPPPAAPPAPALLEVWRDACDARLAVELAVAVLAADRARPATLDGLAEPIAAMDAAVDDFPAYRQADVRLHVGLAEAAASPRLIAAMTDAQGEMTDLVALIAHPPEVLAWSNRQHERIVAAVRSGDGASAAALMSDHVRGTEHVLAGLLPAA